ITMMHSHLLEPENMIEPNGKNFDSVSGQFRNQITPRRLRQGQLACSDFDQNFPYAGNAQEKVVGTGIDLLRPRRKLVLFSNRPEKGMSIEESPHSQK